MRFKYLSNLLCLVLSIISFGLYSCEPRSTKITGQTEASITFLSLGTADSVSSGDKLYGGIASYFFVDLANDSFIFYDKTLHIDSIIYFTRRQVSGKIKDLGKNEKILSFLRKAREKQSGNSIPVFDGSLYCGRDYLGIIKSDTINRAFAFRYDFGFADIKEEVKALLITKKNLQSLDTTVNLNEDSILKPILSHPVFSSIHPMPPPDLLLPPYPLK